MMITQVMTLALLAAPRPQDFDRSPGAEHASVRGMTISCQTFGREWGTDAFAAELDRLAELGVNWIAIHPYASIAADGSLRWRDLDPESPPVWLERPIREAHARGLEIFIKPHIAYWGSPFSWRGEIAFEDESSRARFFTDYTRWIVEVARCTRDADAFAVGTELGGMVAHAEDWARIIEGVREVTPAHLTYAANWDSYLEVPFWDRLDCIGVQAYFPLCDSTSPTEADLDEGWRRVFDPLRSLSERTGKPVVFTELGYDAHLDTARTPWVGGGGHGRGGPGRTRDPAGLALQRRCLEVALRTLASEGEKDWLRGAFLWKWFAGRTHGAEDFVLDTEAIRATLSEQWLDSQGATRGEARSVGDHPPR